MAHMNDIAFTSSIPDVCIDERRLPLFIARATLRELIAGLKARATGDAARWCYLCTVDFCDNLMQFSVTPWPTGFNIFSDFS